MTGLAESLQVDVSLDSEGFIEWVTGETLQISLLEVSDSRCAIGAVCIWEGEVTALMSIQVDGTAEEQVELTLPGRDEQRAVAVIDGFAVRVVAVAPYPVLDEEPELSEYDATLVILRAERDHALELRGQWRLQSLEEKGETALVLPGTELSISIDLDDGSTGLGQGTGGCNAFTTSVEVGEHASIVMSDLGSTEIACGSPAGINGSGATILRNPYPGRELCRQHQRTAPVWGQCCAQLRARRRRHCRDTYYVGRTEKGILTQRLDPLFLVL